MAHRIIKLFDLIILNKNYIQKMESNLLILNLEGKNES